MKKLLSLVICLIGLTSLNVAAESKVTVYVFRGHDCPHCFDALKYFYNNRDKADYEVKSIEVWKNENNKPFYNAVLDHFSEEDGGVPYIVIGNNYHAAGYADSMIMDITNSIKQAQKDENYSDVIENLLKDYPDVKVDSLSDAASSGV